MMYYAFDEYEWEETGNEGIVAMAEIGEDVWIGAVSMWLDCCEPYNDYDGHYFAFFGEVFASDWDEAYDKLLECTDGNVIHEVGWFRTHDGGALALRDVAGFKYREHLYK